MPRKPHPSSVLKTLPDEDQAALFEFLRDKTLKDGVAWLFSNNGIRTNDTSLSDWRGWYEMNHTIDGYLSDVDELKIKLADIGTDPDLIPKIGEAVFLGKAAKTGDAKMFATVAAITQRHMELKSNQQAHADKMGLEEKKLARKDRALEQAQQKIAQQDRKIALLESKLKDADDVAQNTALSPEEKALRWKQIFGR